MTFGLAEARAYIAEVRWQFAVHGDLDPPEEMTVINRGVETRQ